MTTMTVSWSRLKTWRRCHKLYDYRYNQLLQRKRPAVPLIRGSILDEMVNAHYTGSRQLTPEKVLEKYRRKYRKLFREEREMYGDLLGECERIFRGYVAHWKDDPLTFIRSQAMVKVELAPGLQFMGFIDKIAKDRHNLHWVLDHKSHKSLPNEDARYSDLQLVFYVWAWNKQSPSLQVDGIIWDYLRTKPPTIPELLKSGELSQRKNIDTDHATYLATIREHKLNPKDYADILKSLKARGSQYYRRVPLPHPPRTMIEQIVEEATNTAIEIRELGHVLADRNMTRDCSWCDFFQLCNAELRGLDADFVRKAEYKPREYPEERHGEEEDSE